MLPYLVSPERVRFAVTYTSEKAPTWSTMKKVEPKLQRRAYPSSITHLTEEERVWLKKSGEAECKKIYLADQRRRKKDQLFRGYRERILQKSDLIEVSLYKNHRFNGVNALKRDFSRWRRIASVDGELALGKNVLVAYMPWEGYNSEDAH